MAYICCSPGCGNALYPQGPINMLVYHDEGFFNIGVELDENAKLKDDSLVSLKAAMPRTYDSQELQLNTSDEIAGAPDGFTIRDFKLTIPGRHSAATPQGMLTICCKKCGKCCKYPY